jgi:ribosome-associated translation inhibitor RaiA
MQIDIQALNFSLTPALRGYVIRRLYFTLGTRADHIQRVMVRLSDSSGPHGGESKRCQIRVKLPHLPDVLIEDTEVDLYAAIGRAADRAGRSVGRRLTRQRGNVHSYKQRGTASSSELPETG